jgi:hypothetical protein
MDGRDEWANIKPIFVQTVVFVMLANGGSYKFQDFERI